MAEIRWTEEALKWFRNIYDYISEDNSIAAQKVIEGIYEKTQLLANFPEIGYKYRDETDGQVRILLYGHYRIAYLIKQDDVEILGIFHGSMEIGEYIK
ncbi:MAG TPA: type II toxin-antitoxin system RelE/ParE family toxin [Chromatiaceae bacterium]|jgi:toxin ParE1/3/4|nr:MAG: plasmid stabilization protein [Thiohalocapsa sp. PB-PSB1]QQO52737.1 MAG: type II toxin-antitoxin system RelE/ParE family toxin [Thiohalocapsa sp. PB-PSB1]HBG96909.1 type II toxin-antitoxin system RelE/ParE family toxin [Chromatiaceae bacterium]HCS89862.1 type II toxin-antitoxin system RelE/ParE family toxin [Chromatiaceae bacterium]